MNEAQSPTVPCISRLEACVDQLMQSTFDADTKVFVTTLLKIIDNLLSKPYDAKVRQLRAENPAVKNKLLSRRGGAEVLLACGFVQESTPPPLLSGPAPATGEQLLVYPHEDTSFLRTARRLLVKRLVQDLGAPSDQLPPEPPRVVAAPSNTGNTTATSFNVYSGHRFDAASAALGVQVAPDAQYVSKTEATLQTLTKKQEQLERQLQQAIVDRQWKASRPGDVAQAAVSTNSTTTDQSAGKSDSNLLAARIQKQQLERQKQESGFTTHAMREVERLKKARVYSHTVLTIQFDDGCKLSGRFSPGETLGQVKQALQDDCLVEVLEFDLVVTPPRRILGVEQTLQQEGLVPAAKVVVSWKAPQSQRKTQPGWYFKPQLLESDDAASSGALSFPESKPIIEAIGDDRKPTAGAAAAAPKPPPETREEALLRRMMGGGGGRAAGPAATSSSSAAAGPPQAAKPSDKKPKWFKG
jgi:PUB domain/UBX domain